MSQIDGHLATTATTGEIADGTMRLTVDIAVDATDGSAGSVRDIILDPRSRRITDLVVRPHGRDDDARLIPIDAVSSCDERLALSWSLAEIERAQPVQEVAAADHWHEGDESITAGVSRSLGRSSFGAVGSFLAQGALGRLATLTPTTYDAIPAGSVEVRRGSEVVGSDRHVVGHVCGLIVERDGRITHVVVARGNLWARREVDVLVTHVASFVSDRVQLNIGRDLVDTFPSTRPRRHDHARQAVMASTPSRQ